ncbi:type IV secretion system protein [Helicobacter pylori]|uniref:type IV secretion system protein n=1 Tax=Helicobacter pylori TaxID=210 RepID=UPI000D35E783|nr:type IV secretion system protein [Helicobacter pylori]MCQ2684093.1 type IV secretion system protein [Helicobacter pylori]MCQ2968149.1 type IV secretion system protein [Helicobacter pylori]MDU9711086.1 type IV secretion system protein [Helicobacter pylori]MDU9728779.1 type IV secretion system protein [Helicobacter pylori]MDU9770958.1 type IV secretion system protein [Helicobacter pylori]
MQGNNLSIYETILSLFSDPTKKIFYSIATQTAEVLKAQMIINAVLVILFMVWAYRRVKEGDIFQFKTAMGVVVFIAFVGVLNWAMDNPTTYMNMLKDTIFYPSNKLTEIITNSMSSLQIGNNNLTLGSLIDKSYYSIIQLYREVFSDLGWKTFFTMFPMLIIFLLLVLAQILLIGLILIIVLITLVETLTWLSLGFAVLPLALFPQTKGMLFSYLKKLISLTFYQPCIMVVAFLNFSMIESITLKIPTKAEIINGFYNKGHIIDQMIENGSSQAINNFQNAMGAYTSVLGFFIILILGSVVCFFLIKRVPDFINNIFGTSGGVGAVTEMMQKIGMTIGGAVVGGSMVMVANQMKQAYQNAGGGLAGLQAGAKAFGLGAISGGASAMANHRSVKAGVKHFVASVKNGFDNNR